MADLVDGLVAGLPAAARSRAGGAGRGHPAVRRRDGARADRPRPRRPPRGSLRRRRRRRPRPRRDRRAGVAAGAGRRPARRADPGGEAGRHRRQRARASSFTREGLLALGPDAGDRRRGRWRRCVRKEILAVQTDRFTAERGQYRFVQSVVRQVAYATQSQARPQDPPPRRRRPPGRRARPRRRPRRGDRPAPARRRRRGARPATRDVPALHGPGAGPTWSAGAGRARAVGAPGEALRLLELALAHSEDAATGPAPPRGRPGRQRRRRFSLARRSMRSPRRLEFDKLGELPRPARPWPPRRASSSTSATWQPRSRSPNPADVLDGVDGVEPALLDLTQVLGRASAAGRLRRPGRFHGADAADRGGMGDANAIALALLGRASVYAASAPRPPPG